MRLGLAASAGTIWLLLKEGLSEFAFAAHSHEGSVPAGRTRATTALRVWGSCSSGNHEVSHAAMSSTAEKGQRLTRAAMCVDRDVGIEASVSFVQKRVQRANTQASGWTGCRRCVSVCHPRECSLSLAPSLCVRACTMTRFATVDEWC